MNDRRSLFEVMRKEEETDNQLKNELAQLEKYAQRFRPIVDTYINKCEYCRYRTACNAARVYEHRDWKQACFEAQMEEVGRLAFRDAATRAAAKLVARYAPIEYRLAAEAAAENNPHGLVVDPVEALMFWKFVLEKRLWEQ